MSADGLHVEDNLEEHVIIETIKELRINGMLLQDIALQLSFDGYQTRSGNPFTLSHISKLARM